jgi:hypothetical protein
MLDEPIDSAWMADLARSLLAASSAGRLLQAPETAFRALEEVAAERGIALVAVEPPPPLEPPVIVTQPETLIVERVFVPAFPLHHRSFFHHRHFRNKSFKDRPHLEPRFPKNHGARQHHPLNSHPRHPAGRKIAGFRNGETHSVQSGSTRLTAGGSTLSSVEGLTAGGSTLSSVEGLTAGGSTLSSVEGLTGTGSTMLRPEPLGSARGKLVEGLTAGSMGHSVRTCF